MTQAENGSKNGSHPKSQRKGRSGGARSSSARASSKGADAAAASLTESGARSSSKRASASNSQASSDAQKRPVRFAVVGLGHIAQVAVLPAFEHAKKDCELVALITNDRKKLEELGKRHNIQHLAAYEDYERCLEDSGADAVYIALPNSMHAEFCVRAARMGVHVLCEKPLAVTEEECIDMIEACERSDVQLMTAYRLHFEQANLKAVELARSGKLGEVMAFSSVFTMQVEDRENIRLRGDMGGGPLHDLGVYCINAARMIFGCEPTEVAAFAAWPNDERFEEVPATVSATLRYPGDRLATFICSFGLTPMAQYAVIGTKGKVELDPAYEYSEPLAMEVTIDEKSRGPREMKKVDQFAPQLMHFARCVREGCQPEPSGHEGLADVRIIRALQWSLRTGRVARLDPWELPERRPEPEQARSLPAVRKPKLVNAQSASGD